ncbi:MAG: type II secretion system major pseudopilin GspG [Planctomycetota bacterium]
MLCPNSGSKRSAFSLVELIVVMVILGLLAGLVVVQTRGYLIRSRQKIAETEIATLVSALETFYANENRYPSSDEGLEVLAQPSENYPEPYIRKLTKDPWGNAYEYFSPGSSGPYEVICLGADGREGGDGENRDFSSGTLGV